jgi:hypothetical protein
MDDVSEMVTLAMAWAIEAGMVFGLTAGTLYPLIGTLALGLVTLGHLPRRSKEQTRWKPLV